MRTIATILAVSVLGYTGGTTTQQWLAASGTLAAPSYSFSSETDNGLYRIAAGAMCVGLNNDLDGLTCFKSGQLLTNSSSTGVGSLQMSLAYPFTFSTTNTFTGAQYDGAVDMFIGTRSGTPILAPHLTGTSTHAMSFTPSSGNLTMGNSTGTAWSSSTNNIGGSNAIAMNHKFSIGAGDLYSFDSDDNTGVKSATVDEISWMAGGATVAYSRGQNFLEFPDGKYLRIGTVTGTTVVANCSSTAEDGRVVVNYGDNRLYVCNYTGSTSWMYVDLTE